MSSDNLKSSLTSLKKIIKKSSGKLLHNIKNIDFKAPSARNITTVALIFCTMMSTVIFYPNKKEEEPEPPQIVETNRAVALTIQEPTTVNAFGLYIDGEFIAAAATEEEIKSSLDTLLNGKVSSLSVSNVIKSQFMNEIKIENGEFDPSYIVDSSKLNQLLGIEGEYSFTFDLESITGKQVDKEVSVMVSSEVEEEVELEYQTEFVDTDLKNEGYQKVLCAGKDGEGVSTYELVYVDDELVQKNFVSTEVVKEPVEKVIERGISKPSKTVNSLSILAWPYDGRISSYFGWRSLGYHEGLDLIAYSGGCYGDAVYAAKGGVVIFSGEKDGYGKVVFIDHGEGLVTVYAHLSKRLVSEGDEVSTGTPVGNIGTTGRVTGPHLHFEVQLDGKRIDPLKFLTSKSK